MSLESITRTDFYDRLSQIDRTRSITQLLVDLPTAFSSLTHEALLYNDAFKHAPDDLNKLDITISPTILISLWTYSRLTRRRISTLAEEGVLFPFCILYKTLATQDDIFDALRKKGEAISAEKAFWHCPKVFPDRNPVRRFQVAFNLLNSNTHLTQPAKDFMMDKIMNAYSSFVQAEDEIARQSQNESPDLYHIFRLRYQSFGLMAQALTSVLNGNECATDRGLSIEEQMAWFILATEIIDGEIDRDEDRGWTMSLPLSSDISDRKKGQKAGTTSGRIFSMFISEIHNSEIGSLLRFLRYLYPKAEKVLKLLETFGIRKPMTGYTLSVDKDLELL